MQRGILCKNIKREQFLSSIMLQFLQKLFKKEIVQEEAEKSNRTKQQGEDASSYILSPEQFQKLLKENRTIKLIDVRTKEEYEEGHNANAILLPVQELSQEKLDKANIQKEKEVLLYCRSGGRSGRALEMLHSWGYSQAKHMGGGILAWKEKKYPIFVEDNKS